MKNADTIRRPLPPNSANPSLLNNLLMVGVDAASQTGTTNTTVLDFTGSTVTTVGEQSGSGANPVFDVQHSQANGTTITINRSGRYKLKLTALCDASASVVAGIGVDNTVAELTAPIVETLPTTRDTDICVLAAATTMAAKAECEINVTEQMAADPTLGVVRALATDAAGGVPTGLNSAGTQLRIDYVGALRS